MEPSPPLPHFYLSHREEKTKGEVRKMNILAGKCGWRQFQGRVYELEFLPKRNLRKIHSTLNFLCFVAIRENRKMV
jgi:hypothetical protein